MGRREREKNLGDRSGTLPMSDEKDSPQQGEHRRRFRLVRKVASPPPETREEQELKALAEDDALRGSPEQLAELNRGCSGCWKVTLLILVIMMASVIGTCALVDLPIRQLGF